MCFLLMIVMKINDSISYAERIFNERVRSLCADGYEIRFLTKVGFLRTCKLLHHNGNFIWLTLDFRTYELSQSTNGRQCHTETLCQP